MHKFRTILSVVATAAMVLGTMGVASAASATNESRADFIVQLDQSLGIQPVTPSTADFTDVPSTNADYGYIEAAYQKGFINGISAGLFGPTLPITRAEAAKILVEAYEGGNYTPTQTSTTFTDNSSIPTALVGFVAEANSLKLMLGFTAGSFGPNAYLTTAQETHLIAQLQAVQASAAFKVSASSTDVAVGQLVTLSSTGAGTTTYTVTGANAAQAIISGSTFAASAAGTYTVTGTNGGNTATVTVDVYGAAAALKISAPTSVVANGASQANVTVSVVDANGNVVGNSTDNVTLASNNTYGVTLSNSATGTFGSTATVTAVNGVATFVLQSGVIPGSSVTLTATDPNDSNVVQTTSYTATVNASAQVATTLGVSPATQYLSVNGGSTSTAVDVQVLDQSGQPMLFGTYAFSASLSGPGEFTDGTAGPDNFAYNGPGYTTSGGIATPNSGSAAVTVDGEQGVTGAITLTVSGTNLKSATGTVTAVISGTATAFQLAAPTTTSFAQGSASGEYAISVVDSHGYPVSAPSGQNVLVTISNSSGVVDGTSGTFEIYAADGSGQIGGGTVGSNGVEYSYSALANGFTVFDTNTSGDAGSYTIQVSDPAGNLTASPTSTLTEAGATATVLSVTSATYVSAATPTITITAQLTDTFGNDITESGVPVTFSATGSNAGNETLSSTSAVDTNSSGAATITVTVPSYVGDNYSVNATAALPPSGNTVTGTTSFMVQSTVATQVTASLKDQGPSSFSGSLGIAQAGDTVLLTVYAYDQYSTPITTPDTINLSYGGTGVLASTLAGAVAPSSITLNGSGYQTLTLYAYTSGTVTVTASDGAVASGPSGNASMAVQSGSVNAFALYDASGNNASGESVTANTPVALILKAADAYGNAAIANANFTVDVTTSTYGTFRVGSASNPSVTQIAIPDGSTGVTVYYVDGASGTPTFTTTSYAGWSDATNSLTVANSGTITLFGSTSGAWTVSASGGTIASSTYTAPATGSGTATLTFTPASGQVITFTVTY